MISASLLTCACVVGPARPARAADAPPGGARAVPAHGVPAYEVPAHEVSAYEVPAARASATARPGEADPHAAPRDTTGHHVHAGAPRAAVGASPAPHRARPTRWQELAAAGQGPLPVLAAAAAALLLGGAGLLAAARRLRG